MSVFSIFTTKKKRSHDEHETAAARYESYARRTGYFKYITLFLLIVFITFGFTFFSADLSVDNFRYMLKFMSVDADMQIADGTTIEYDTGEFASTLIIKGDLAIVDGNGASIYGMMGEKYLGDTEYFTSPMCVSNGTNLLVCDRGGSSLNAYSVYAKVYTASFDYPVLDLCASPSGRYAVQTTSKGYRSGLEVYDKEFRLIYYNYFSDRYVTGIAISHDGNRAAACTLSNTAEGGYLGTLYYYNLDDESDILELAYADEIPWKISFRPDGTFLLMTNRSVRIYSASGELTAVTEYGDNTPKGYAFGDDFYAISLSSVGLSDATVVRLYRSDGTYIGETTYLNDVSKMDIADGHAYIYSVGTLYTVRISDLATVRTDTAGMKYLCALYDGGENRLIFVYTNKAVIYDAKSYTSGES